MNRRLSTILFLAFLVAVIASYLVFRIASSQMHGNTAQTTKIIMAAKDLPIGDVD